MGNSGESVCWGVFSISGKILLIWMSGPVFCGFSHLRSAQMPH